MTVLYSKSDGLMFAQEGYLMKRLIMAAIFISICSLANAAIVETTATLQLTNRASNNNTFDWTIVFGSTLSIIFTYDNQGNEYHSFDDDGNIIDTLYPGPGTQFDYASDAISDLPDFSSDILANGGVRIGNVNWSNFFVGSGSSNLWDAFLYSDGYYNLEFYDDFHDGSWDWGWIGVFIDVDNNGIFEWGINGDQYDYLDISVINSSTRVVPVPGSILLFASGLIGLTGMSRKKFKN